MKLSCAAFLSILCSATLTALVLSQNSPPIPYISPYGKIQADDIQCPIPMENRVHNHSGIQCVYSSIETLGRWAEEPKLMFPPITSRQECQGYSGPYEAAKMLNLLDVRFEQSYRNEVEGLNLINQAMSEGRGCLFGITNHVMVLVHYSEQENRVCWIDTSDSSLKVQTMTISTFKRKWDHWVLVIYADEDRFDTFPPFLAKIH